MNRKLTMFLMSVVVLSLLLIGQVGYANEAEKANPEIIVRGKILSVTEQQETNPDLQDWIQGKEQLVTAKILSEPYQGQEVSFFHVLPDQLGLAVLISPGDEVVLSVEVTEGKVTNAFVSDHARDKKIYFLAGCFAVIMVVIGGLKGAKSVLSLTLTGVGILGYYCPCCLRDTARFL